MKIFVNPARQPYHGDRSGGEIARVENYDIRPVFGSPSDH